MTINGIENDNVILEQKNYSSSDLVFKTIGKRKCATATLLAFRGQAQITVNGQLIEDYFQYDANLLNSVMQPFKLLNVENLHSIIISSSIVPLRS